MPRYPSRYASQSSFSFGPGPISTALKIIIGVNVAMFLATTIVPELRIQLGLVPMWVVTRLHVWQLVTYMFIHAGVFHILFNMLALWMFGAELERVWGTRYFLKFYFVTGIGAGVLTVLVSLLPFAPVAQLYASDIIGASGADLRAAAGVCAVLSQSADLHVLRLPDPGEATSSSSWARWRSTRRCRKAAAASPTPRTSAACSSAMCI